MVRGVKKDAKSVGRGTRTGGHLGVECEAAADMGLTRKLKMKYANLQNQSMQFWLIAAHLHSILVCYYQI